MSGIMLITNRLEDSPKGGRELLCKLNHDVLKEIYGNRLMVCELTKNPVRGVILAAKAFSGHIDGLSAKTIAQTVKQIRAKNVENVFVDGSNLGEIVRAIKAEFPEVRVLTFFHNVEAIFFWGALRQSKTPRSLAVTIANYLAEKKSVRYSDYIISLSERDSRLLKRLYGRTATNISPIALQDKFTEISDLSDSAVSEGYALFVGGSFYANRAGIKWFVKHVSPHIRIKTCIVGKGLEDLRRELEAQGKVEIVGEVESLAEWYLNAHFVIAPVFDGSGMKTKVAEALMFGKKIIGTPEAFSGYEDIANSAGCVCVTPGEFIRAIEHTDTMIKSPFDTKLRSIYEEKYSYAAAKKRLTDMLLSIG